DLVVGIEVHGRVPADLHIRVAGELVLQFGARERERARVRSAETPAVDRIDIAYVRRLPPSRPRLRRAWLVAEFDEAGVHVSQSTLESRPVPSEPVQLPVDVGPRPAILVITDRANRDVEASR